MDALKDLIEFVPVNEGNLHLIEPLAKSIWQATYLDIIGQEQIDYMLPMMYSDACILKEIEEGAKWELVLRKGELVGYVDYVLERDNSVFLSKIYTDIDKGIKGLGKYMLEHVLAYSKSVNAKAVYLTVNKNNRRAIAFYERNGMKRIASKTFDIGGGYVMDDYIYQIEI